MAVLSTKRAMSTRRLGGSILSFFLIVNWMSLLQSDSLWHNLRDTTPESTPLASPAFPGIRVHQVKVVNLVRSYIDLRIDTRNDSLYHRLPTSLIKIQLRWVLNIKFRPSHRSLSIWSSDVRRNRRITIDDELAPDILKCLYELGALLWQRGTEICVLVCAVTGGWDGVFVFVRGAKASESFCYPIGKTDKGSLGVS
jgi:hypothetical protein